MSSTLVYFFPSSKLPHCHFFHLIYFNIFCCCCCSVLLYNVVLHVDIVDKWKCHLDPIKGYIVSSTSLLTNVDTYAHSFFSDIIWHKETLLKVSLFVCLFSAIVSYVLSIYFYEAFFNKILSFLWEVLALMKRHNMFLGCNYFVNI